MTRHRGPSPRARAGKADDDATADAEAFARAMENVTRLAPDPRGRVRPGPQSSPRRAAPSPARPSSTAPPATHDSDDDAGSGFVAAGVDRRELRKLKRGAHEPASRLDLHGLTAAKAVDNVARFIDQSRHRCRCVCIVHGRGLHSQGSVPILKARVRACLRQHPAVLAYADAPRNDGGDGAVYVLLRKQA